MPQNRVSTKVLKTRGSFVKHPERARERAAEPKPTGDLGPPPKGLNQRARRLWKELEHIIPPGVAASSDGWAFKMLVCLMAKFDGGRATSGESKQIESLLSKMGMTPSDRSRVSTTRPALKEEDDPLAEFL